MLKVKSAKQVDQTENYDTLKLTVVQTNKSSMANRQDANLSLKQTV